MIYMLSALELLSSGQMVLKSIGHKVPIFSFNHKMMLPQSILKKSHMSNYQYNLVNTHMVSGSDI
jgi:hypothetical protein